MPKPAQVTQVRPGAIPAELRQAAADYLGRSARQAATALAQLTTIVDTMTRARIDWLPLKGPVFGILACGNPALQGYRDLDVLIRPERTADAMAVLHSRGPSLGRGRSRRLSLPATSRVRRAP